MVALPGHLHISQPSPRCPHRARGRGPESVPCSPLSHAQPPPRGLRSRLFFWLPATRAQLLYPGPRLGGPTAPTASREMQAKALPPSPHCSKGNSPALPLPHIPAFLSLPFCHMGPQTLRLAPLGMWGSSWSRALSGLPAPPIRKPAGVHSEDGHGPAVLRRPLSSLSSTVSPAAWGPACLSSPAEQLHKNMPCPSLSPAQALTYGGHAGKGKACLPASRLASLAAET